MNARITGRPLIRVSWEFLLYYFCSNCPGDSSSRVVMETIMQRPFHIINVKGDRGRYTPRLRQSLLFNRTSRQAAHVRPHTLRALGLLKRSIANPASAGQFAHLSQSAILEYDFRLGANNRFFFRSRSRCAPVSRKVLPP